MCHKLSGSSLKAFAGAGGIARPSSWWISESGDAVRSPRTGGAAEWEFEYGAVTSTPRMRLNPLSCALRNVRALRPPRSRLRSRRVELAASEVAVRI